MLSRSKRLCAVRASPRQHLRLAVLVTAALLLAPATVSPLLAQEESSAAGEEEEKPKKWSTETEASVVSTEGNAETFTFGLSNNTQRRWERGSMTFRGNAARADSSDDRFRLVEAGLTWEPGESIPPFNTTLVEPGKDTDIEKFFAELRYDRSFKPRFLAEKRKASWHVGQSWDRNEDSGILNRYITFAGLGTTWWDKEKIFFKTSYGFSHTDREEDKPDPEKDDRFTGARLHSEFTWQLNDNVSLGNEWTGNVSLADTNDWSVDMTTRFTMDISTHLKFRFSVQWLYNNEPALEDIDIVARVIIVDPDGIPGNGDEFFETVDSGGFEIEGGEVRERLDELDTIIRSSLVIKY